MKATIRISYDIVTPESAECGDTAESGWIDEQGEQYTLREAVTLLEGCEPSASHYHRGVWYTSYGERDWRTGEVENRAYHIDAPEAFRRRLFQALARK